MRVLLLTAAIVVAVLTIAGTAAAKPGDAMFVTEQDVERALEKHVDFAFCRGIARYGARTTGPYGDRKFLRFDCSTDLGGEHCYDIRYRSVQASKPGWFVLATASLGDCYGSR